VNFSTLKRHREGAACDGYWYDGKNVQAEGVTDNMRITLVISSLAGGGAERVATNMSNYWSGNGWEITILTTSHGTRGRAYDLLPGVAHRDLALSSDSRGSRTADREALIETLIAMRELLDRASWPERGLVMWDLELLARLRRAIQDTRPQAVISFIDLTNIRTLLAATGLDVPVIVSEQCDPHHNNVGAGIHLLRRRVYPQAKYVVALTEESMAFFSDMKGVRGRIIPNPVLPPVSDEEEEYPLGKNGFLLMGMGRLSHEKGFDLLLRAFGMVAQEHPCWSLEIWGEGSILDWLEQFASKLGLSDRVRFPGFTRTPHRAMKRADLFAVSSLCEGFPNVLCEAMASGLPVVSFDCPSGPRHIIRNGVDGVLVPPRNVPAMAEALDRLMRDQNERRRLAARAPEVVRRFAVKDVMSMWEQLLPDSPRDCG
jgi:GalNAc-alpha-(1->4)-GalNAc-alpha-(1->3)-diNAcBac-PP-undecaprenol alpha-1,4-N-acetyl-D-galactosaminyltransferase